MRRRRRRRLEDLVSADFPECDPEKFEAWKRAELSFQRQRTLRMLTIGVAIIWLSASLTAAVRFWANHPFGFGVRCLIGGVVAISTWLWYAYVVLRISPKGKAVKKLYLDMGIPLDRFLKGLLGSR